MLKLRGLVQTYPPDTAGISSGGSTNPSEKILCEIKLKLTFHSQNAKCNPANFNALKIFSVSCLNLEVSLDFVAFSLFAKKNA